MCINFEIRLMPRCLLLILLKLHAFKPVVRSLLLASIVLLFSDFSAASTVSFQIHETNNTSRLSLFGEEVAKTQFNGSRVLFFAGLEGSGHFFFKKILQACKEGCLWNETLANTVWKDVTFAEDVDSRDKAMLALSQVFQDPWVQQSQNLISINTLGGEMMSIPRETMAYSGDPVSDKALRSVDLSVLARVAEQSHTDFRIVYLTRSAFDILTDIYTERKMSTVKVEVQNLSEKSVELAAMLSRVDPKFIHCVDIGQLDLPHTTLLAQFMSPSGSTKVETALIDAITTAQYTDNETSLMAFTPPELVIVDKFQQQLDKNYLRFCGALELETETAPAVSVEPETSHGNMTNPCINSGPYIWDRITHQEGIGSGINWRKFGIILSDSLQAPWLGTIYNGHDTEEPRANAARFLGLESQGACDESALLAARETSAMKFVDWDDLRAEHTEISHYTMCNGTYTPAEIRTHLNVDSNTVVELNRGHLVQAWIYCTFNERFRTRFYDVQVKEGRYLRPQDEFWITVHFRWGDTATGRVDSPGSRTGAGLTRMAKDTKAYADQHPNARIFFLSEGSQDEFKAFQGIIPSVEYRLDGLWQDALWLMSQSNILVGGTSSFFILGASLCDQCTVVTVANQLKFRVHPEEHNSHLDLKSLK